MCCKKNFLKSIRIALTVFALLVLANVAQAQSGAPAPTPTDPGPRPTGNEALNPPSVAVCPIPGVKFPETVCLDFVQPQSPNVPADGAGQLVGREINPSGPTPNLAGTWFEALTVFSTTASVNGTDDSGNPGQFLTGLGPSFNTESCFQCHSQPAVGGSSPGCVENGAFCSNMLANPNTGVVTATFTESNNPEFVDAKDRGATNTRPSFVIARESTGPLVEARFPAGLGNGPSTLGNPATVPMGAVAELYVINGRSDAPTGCQITQEPFGSVSDIIFRIPIPTFGDGFVENTPETALDAAAVAAQNEAPTVCGTSNPTCGISFQVFNTSGNDQTITRFGWKAQNKSLLMFSGEASNVEMGVTNELFTTERTYGNGSCTTNGLPEDVTQSLNSTQIESITGPLPTTPVVDEPGVTSDISSNIENDSIFMRLNGAPSICNWNSGVSATTGLALCNTADQSVLRGAALFGNSVLSAPSGTAPTNIGCVLCHWQTQTTGPANNLQPLNNATFHPFSDFALHHMGGLADGVKQGTADVDQFRTAPLWGLGQRLFFLHDGREPKNPPVANQNPLYDTIQDHCLPVPAGSAIPVSEACAVVSNFNNLPVTSACPVNNSTCNCNTSACTASQEDVMHFLRSL